MNKIILLSIIVIFFSLNMGGSGIAPSFAVSLGAKLIEKKYALLLFGIFVIIGAVSFGSNVAYTLGKSLLPEKLVNLEMTLAILGSASVSLFIANILKIPQSTSQVTVGAIVGAGIYTNQLNLEILFTKIIPMWIILPLISYFLTLFLYKKIYPPRQKNLYIYEKLFANEKKIKFSTLITSCYVAFSIGSNNVANAVGPLFGAGIINIIPGLFLIAPLFGIGAALMGKGTIETTGKAIVPLGLISSTLVCFITATLLLFASFLGIPQSLVQLNLASIFAISCLKNEHQSIWDHHLIQKAFTIWLVTPLCAIGITYLSLFLLK
ncbi:inorganic phosphate transporter [Candidatus Desantisbacteria bacterium]|nr:inorganic phosphate transporter [Candidatus Desantisbacteria bacterium]